MEKNNFLINKKGASPIFSFWFLFIMIIVAGSLVAGIMIVFGSDSDVRNSESRILYNKIFQSISSNGNLKDSVLGQNFNLMAEAGLNPKVINENNFYFNLSIYKNGEMVRTYYNGTKDYEVLCRLKGTNFPKCIYRELVLLNESNNEDYYKISILAGSNHNGGIF